DGFAASYKGVEARQRHGLASLFELEDARRSLIAARLALIEVKRDRVNAWVALYRALGGGWKLDDQLAEADAMPAATRPQANKKGRQADTLMKLSLKPGHRKPLLIGAAVIAALALLVVATRSGKPAADTDAGPSPSLSVNVEVPLSMRMSQRISANGNIEAWQEAVIGANVSGLILSDVKVNVGDVVKKGQVLATFSSQTVAAELEQSRARAAEAEASALEAEANAERARKVADSGALSEQQLTQYLTAAQTARARAKAQLAAERAQAVRLADTRIVAPDDGVISSRTATV